LNSTHHPYFYTLSLHDALPILVRGALPIEERNFRIDYVFSFNERNQLLKNQQLNKDLHQETKKIFEKAPMKDEIHEMMYFDFHRSEEHTSELQSRFDLVCRLLL